MSLTIGRLKTRASMPRRLQSMAATVNRLTREALPRACRLELAAAWSTRPAICRIRRLYIRLEVPPQGLTEAGLRASWSAAFSRALVSAVNQPSSGDEIVVADSRAEWIATFLLDVLKGADPGWWAYAEFDLPPGAPAGETVLGMLAETPSEIADVMAALARRGGVPSMLAALGAAGCDRLVGLIDAHTRAPAARLSLADLVAVGRLALTESTTAGWRGPLATSPRAVALYAARLRASEGTLGDAASPGRILAALRMLDRLLGLHRSADSPSAGVPEWSTLLVDGLWASAGESVFGRPADVRRAGAGRTLARQLDDVLEALRGAMPRMVVTGAPIGRWVTSRCAGLLLLVDSIRRLGWPEAIRPSLLWGRHGSRALTYVLAGVGLHLLGRSTEDVTALEPGAALLAGWTDAPHVAGLVHCLQASSEEIRRDLLDRLASETDRSASADSWDATFGYLAAELVTAFATQVRGFRKASRRFLVERFVAVPGRICVEPERVLVMLEANPLLVAVHLSGLDQRVDGVSWLGGRRVEFVLEGL